MARRRTALQAFAAVLTAACSGCADSSPLAPSPPDTTNPIVSVTVAFGAPRPASIRPAEVVQLKAVALRTDNSTADCTETATWSSSNAQVLKLTGARPGEVVGVSAGDATITAACGAVRGDLAAAVPSLTRLTVTTAAGHSHAFTIGEGSQLYATAYFSDNTTTDCTALAQWSSDNPDVMRMQTSPGAVLAVTTGTSVVRAHGHGGAAALGVLVGPGIRISGFENYPDYVLLNSHIRMHAAIIDGGGQVVRDCTSEAVWGTSDSSIARPGSTNSSLGRLFVQSAEGEVTISASCLGQTGQIRVRIGHFTLSGVVRATTGAAIADALVGASTRSSGSGSYALDLVSETPTIKVSHVGFETLSTAITWNQQPVIHRDMLLSPLPDIFRQGEGRLCQIYGTAECEAGAARQDVITFTVPRDGNLRLSTHWQAPGGSGVDSDLIATLSCNGSKLPGFPRYITTGTGGGFTIAAATTCQYALTMQNATIVKALPYQWTLNMQ